MQRRYFVSYILGGLSFPVITNLTLRPKAEDYVMTVSGKIQSNKLGLVLPHEHIMSNFGAQAEYTGKYNKQKLFQQVVPYLEKVKSMGCNTIIECTTAYFGRNVNLLKEISEKAKMNIITNTGWYGAANDRYIPKKAYNMTSEAIAGIWVQEWTHGINNTGIKPGFIKLAVDGGPLSEIDKKLVIAGAHAHLKTGLTVQVHTGDNKNAAFQQLEAIKNTGMHPSGWIWVHAQNNDQVEPLLYAAKEGAWISLDGVKNDSKIINHTLRLLNGLADAGYMNQVLLSHDGNGFPTGGPVRPFEALMTDFIPKLEMEGYSNKDINLLTRNNPQKAFSVKIRRI